MQRCPDPKTHIFHALQIKLQIISRIAEYNSNAFHTVFLFLLSTIFSSENVRI